MAFVEYERDGAIGLVTLNRPERLNARSDALEADLRTAWQRFEADGDAKVALLSGAGKSFCAGMDLKERPDRKSITGERLQSVAGTHDVTKPIVAAIHGYCLGGGLTLAMSTDIRIAAASAVFGFPEIRYGIHPNTPYFVANLIPVCVIAELALTAENITAQRAREVGLINRVVSDDRLLAEARAVAERMASFPLRVLQLGKQTLRKATELAPEAWELMGRNRRETYGSNVEAEGVAAFREKRPPRWERDRDL
jgi:enoyl-CoA hydratase/carnithine racemase